MIIIISFSSLLHISLPFPPPTLSLLFLPLLLIPFLFLFFLLLSRFLFYFIFLFFFFFLRFCSPFSSSFSYLPASSSTTFFSSSSFVSAPLSLLFSLTFPLPPLLHLSLLLLPSLLILFLFFFFFLLLSRFLLLLLPLPPHLPSRGDDGERRGEWIEGFREKRGEGWRAEEEGSGRRGPPNSTSSPQTSSVGRIPDNPYSTILKSSSSIPQSFILSPIPSHPTLYP